MYQLIKYLYQLIIKCNKIKPRKLGIKIYTQKNLDSLNMRYIF